MGFEGKTLILAFEPAACRDLAYELAHTCQIQHLVSRETFLRKYVESTSVDWDHIVAIGLSKQLKRGLGVETRFVNRFKGSPIETGGPEFIQQSSLLDLPVSQRITWSYCNLISYLFCRRIQTLQLSTQYSFVHINPRYAAPAEIAHSLGRTFNSVPMQVG